MQADKKNNGPNSEVYSVIINMTTEPNQETNGSPITECTIASYTQNGYQSIQEWIPYKMTQQEWEKKKKEGKNTTCTLFITGNYALFIQHTNILYTRNT